MSNQGEATWNSWINAAKKEKEKKAKDERKTRFESMSSDERQELIEKKKKDKIIRENKLPDNYYESEEYKKFCEERKKKYEEIYGKDKPVETINNIYEEEVFYGERGGRYRYRYNRDGLPYRDYF